MDALGRAALRIETLSTRIWTQGHPVMRRRYGLRLAFRAGVACFTAERGLFGDALTYGHKAIGFGTTVPATHENPVSAANLAELGFRRWWRIVHWSAE